jgi:hypothetical protein
MLIMKKYLLSTLFIILSSVVIIFISCGKPTEHSLYWADLEGRVIDSTTMMPITEAEVFCHPLDNIGDTIAVTDSNGVYKFTYIYIRTTRGEIELTASKAGYTPFKKRYNVTSLEYNIIPDIYLFPITDN